jgi:hypothetical protein
MASAAEIGLGPVNGWTPVRSWSTQVRHTPASIPARSPPTGIPAVSPALPPVNPVVADNMAPGSAHLVSPTTRGALVRVAATTAADVKDQEWKNWVDKFNSEWRSRVAQVLHDKFQNLEIDQRVEGLRRRIGPEWAKANNVRTINTSDLTRWMDEMTSIKTADGCLLLLQKIDREVDTKLGARDHV